MKNVKNLNNVAKIKKAKILIVEDERNIAEYIRETLKNFGFDAMEIAVSGEEAIQKAQEMNPDLVLMDIVLKGKIDGIEAAVMIKEQFAIPIIYITAYSDNERVKRAKATKPIGYLLKPFQTRDLRQGIEIALQQN